MDQSDHRDRRGRLETVGQRERRVFWEKRATPDGRVYQACRVEGDIRVTMGLQGLQDPWEMLELGVSLVILDLVVLTGRTDSRVDPDNLARKDRLVQLDDRDLRVLQGHLDPLRMVTAMHLPSSTRHGEWAIRRDQIHSWVMIQKLPLHLQTTMH